MTLEIKPLLISLSIVSAIVCLGWCCNDQVSDEELAYNAFQSVQEQADYVLHMESIEADVLADTKKGVLE